MSSISKFITTYQDCQNECRKFADDVTEILLNYTGNQLDLNPNKTTIAGIIGNLQVTTDGIIVDSNFQNQIHSGVQFDVTYQLRDSEEKQYAHMQLYYHNNQLHREGGKPAVLIHTGQYNVDLKYIERRLNGERLALQFIN